MGQLKVGCKKRICFNRYCRKNIFSTENLLFTNDQELVRFALSTIQEAEDPDDLICSDALTFSRNSLKNNEDDKILSGMLEDAHSFCCSFYDQKLLDEYKPLDKESGDQDMSAFEDFDLTEEQKAHVALKRMQTSKELELHEAKRRLNLLQIDYKAVQLYFRLIKPTLSGSGVQKAISELVDVISLEFDRHDGKKASIEL